MESQPLTEKKFSEPITGDPFKDGMLEIGMARLAVWRRSPELLKHQMVTYASVLETTYMFYCVCIGHGCEFFDEIGKIPQQEKDEIWAEVMRLPVAFQYKVQMAKAIYALKKMDKLIYEA